MISIIFIAFISLIGLLVLHELSHFLVAKKFKVGVEEFGVGYPPRLLGKKIGNTIYSLNLLPFGAFVRISEKKLREKAIWQRALILIAGILSFWIICVILITIIFWVGSPVQVSDEENGNLIDARVQIVAVSSHSPAEEAGLEIGDIIEEFKIPTIHTQQNSKYPLFTHSKIQKIQQVQEITEKYKGEEVSLTIMRGKEIIEMSIIPRVSPPKGEGPMGIGLARIATKRYPFAEAFLQGILTTFKVTWQIVSGFSLMIKRAVFREPIEAELVGPVGILNIFVRAGILGPVYFLQTIAIISLHVAVINALPIPIADGGRLLFLGIEKIRKKPLDEKIEQRINTVFFALLLALMVLVTIKDIIKIF